jgi:tRNA(Arg) A34 adenosine deaminase TadA
MPIPTVEIKMPQWVDEFVSDPQRLYPTVADRMAVVVALARRNIEAGTGGPFGAAIFDMHTGRLVAPGINMVASANCSVAHAEITAIVLAQKIAGSYDLGAAGLPPLELVSSAEPCAMCLGAVIWSGVRRLVCGARDGDARAIGFDEGPKPDRWVGALEDRGIIVIRDVSRHDAVAVLNQYADSGGLIYNARQAAGPTQNGTGRPTTDAS